MIKPTNREPIMLSRCRKRNNQNANHPPFAQNMPQQTHISLQLFQQSLTLHPSRNGQQQYGLPQRDPHRQNKKGGHQNPTEVQEKTVSTSKSNFNRIMNGSVGLTQPQKSAPINENNLIYSLHQAKASFKPVAASTCEKENAILMQPLLTQLKARAISSVSRKADILREIKKAENTIVSSQVKDKENITFKYEQSAKEHCLKGECIPKIDYQALVKATNEEKIAQTHKIQQLQEKIQQKKGLEARVQQIEKQLLELCQQNQHLHQLSEQLSKQDSSLGSKPLVMVRDSFCQTQSSLRPEMKIRSSQEMYNSEWITLARQWKSQLQKERILAINRQIQLKTSIQNLQIESRHKVQRLERQLQQLAERYQSKCQEVKERELIINKYLFNK